MYKDVFVEDEDYGKVRNDIPNLIYEIINRGNEIDYEHPGLRPIRELIQNADDAEAEVMTFRFDRDALLVHNDGLTMEEEYLDALKRIHGATKKPDPNTSGTFGTGFRSAYMYTDDPEIHFGRMRDGNNEVRNASIPLGYEGLKLEKIENNRIKIQNFGRLSTKSTHMGVIFKFPWRTKNKWSELEFEDSEKWNEYLWSSKKIRELALIVNEYVSQALLCCRRLQCIRVIFAGAFPENEKMDYQYFRNYKMKGEKIAIDRQVKLCSGHSPRNQNWFDVNNKGCWKQDSHDWYDFKKLDVKRLGSGLAERREYAYYLLGKPMDDVSNLSKDLKLLNYAYVLLPLFDASEIRRIGIISYAESKGNHTTGKGRSLMYTPIPLGGESPNYFCVSSFLPPQENRLGINMSITGVKKWSQSVLETAIGLMKDNFLKYIEIVKSLQTEDDKEAIIINSIPRNTPFKWFGIPDDSSLQILDDFMEIVVLPSTELVYSNDKWHSLNSCYWLDSEMECAEILTKICKILEVPLLSKNWVLLKDEISQNNYRYFEDTANWLFTWMDRNTGQGGATEIDSPEALRQLILESKLNSCIVSDLNQKRVVNLLQEIVISNPPEIWKDSNVLPTIPCIPDNDGNLKPLIDESGNATFPHTPDKSALEQILIPIRKIQDDYRKTVIEMIDGSKHLSEIQRKMKPTPEQLVAFIDESADEWPEKHADLEKHPNLHLAISKILVDIAKAKPSQTESDNLGEKRFVPCLRHGKIQTLAQSIIKSIDPWQVGSLWFNTPTQQYHREFIFNDEIDDLDWIPYEITSRLRFLAVHDKLNKAEKKAITSFLSTQSLGTQKQPTNVMRTLMFGSPHKAFRETQPSLFIHGQLTKWLSEKPEVVSSLDENNGYKGPPIIDGKGKDQVLKSILRVLSVFKDDGYIPGGLGPVYSRRKGDEGVPFLLSAKNEWMTASSFCLEITPELQELFDVHILHNDIIETLGKEVLSNKQKDKEAFGVAKRLTTEQIIKQVKIASGIGTLGSRNDKQLIQILEVIIDSEDSWGDSDFLKENNWIPAISGMLENPSCILIPSEDNIKILSENYLGFPKSWSSPYDVKKIHRASNDLNMRDEIEDGILLGMMCGEYLKVDSDFPEGLCEELYKSLYTSKLKPETRIDLHELNHGPHSEDDYELQDFTYKLKDGNEIENHDRNRAWVVEDEHLALIKAAYPEKDVVSSSQLRDRNHIDLFRAIGIFNLWPPLYSEILQDISDIEDGEKKRLEGLWNILANLENIPDKDEGVVIPGDSPLKIMLNNIIYSDINNIVLLGEEDSDKDGTEIGKYVFIRAEEEKENWLKVLGSIVEISDRKIGLILSEIENETFSILDDDAQIKSLMWLIGKSRDCPYVLIWKDMMNLQLLSIPNYRYEDGDGNQPNPLCVRTGRNIYWKHFRGKLPLLYSDEENQEYSKIIGRLSKPNVVEYNELERFEIVPPEKDDKTWRSHGVLNKALNQVIRALYILDSDTFPIDNIESLKIESKTGNTGLPRRLSVLWEGESFTYDLDDNHNAKHGKLIEENSLTVFVDEEDTTSVFISTATDLVEAILDSSALIETKRILRKNSQKKQDIIQWVVKLLQIDPTEWGQTDEEPYCKLKEQEWEPYQGNLFESASYLKMKDRLRADYTGCQICEWTTPMDTFSGDTGEALVSIIQYRGAYKGPIDKSRPLGQQLWLCPNHAFSWRRNLIKFSFIEDLKKEYDFENNEEEKKKAVELIENNMRKSLKENQLIVKIYTRESKEVEFDWKDESLRHKEKHGKEILNAMKNWIKDQIK